MSGRVACAVALSMLVAMAAGCGSGGSSGAGGGESTTGGTSTSSSSSDPNSSSYDPAETTLKAAGLEVCSETQTQSSGGLDRSSGVSATRSFLVAPDCMGAKTSPNVITVYQFKDRDSLDAGMSKIKAAYPKGETTQYGAVVILATGPNAAGYMARVKKALPAPS
jgi:type IV secretion system protein TrbL